MKVADLRMSNLNLDWARENFERLTAYSPGGKTCAGVYESRRSGAHMNGRSSAQRHQGRRLTCHQRASAQPQHATQLTLDFVSVGGDICCTFVTYRRLFGRIGKR